MISIVLFLSLKNDVNIPVFRIRIRLFLVLPDPHPNPLVTSTDTAKDPSIIMQKL